MTEITNDIKYIGVNDHETDLFEGQYNIPKGMAYNSYVIDDEKIAVMDTVDARFDEKWANNLAVVLNGRKPDYLVVQHMEPDHSGSIILFNEMFPEAKIVSSKQAFVMMKQFFGTDFPENQVVVGEGGTLELGRHTLKFITAPMVHWPEVIMTYDETDKTLFSADGFGKFGALDIEDDWACEARRYYFGIVGKFGAQVQAVLKKAAALQIERICPLHGPVLTENIGYYVDLYNTWSSYGVESEGVAIAYTSVYGHTKAAAEELADKLKELGCPKVALTDLARDDIAEAVEDAFRYGKLVLATTTYNMDIFPKMREFIEHLTERNFRNRKVGIIENGTWAPTAAKIIKGMLADSKDITYTDTTVTIKSAMTGENVSQLDALARELI
ncbi:MAG: MBL fold metallo-hydrolase [Ruminococcaceae bacterium]|nr:MBL fold metallo-hydrolase [Oscillospiraceae bacterium]